MAPANHNQYAHPYQQSTAQQYSAHHTAPASANIAQLSCQYQPGTTQRTDSMAYQPQSYGSQWDTYGGARDNSQGESSHDGNRETTSRAAEALRNMSNTTDNPNNTAAASQPSVPAAHRETAPSSSDSAPHAQQAHPPPPPHTTQASSGQPQVRLSTGNASDTSGPPSNRGLPSPTMATGYSSQRTVTQMSQIKQKGHESQQAAATWSGPASVQVPAVGSEVAREIRSLMAKMREYNIKDPAILVRIWDEERRAKVPKSPTVQNSSVPPSTATSVQAKGTPAANQGKKAAPKEALTPTAAAVPTRNEGNTIWPPEKKARLAAAAASYLKARNPIRSLEADDILHMLVDNPSYIQLCERLESMGLSLDRAGFARDLLTAVPDVSSTSQADTVRSPTMGPIKDAMNQKFQTKRPVVKKRDIGMPATPAAASTPAAPTLPNRLYTPFSSDNTSATPTTMDVAEAKSTKPEFRLHTTKEEAARKRNFNDLVDMTQLREDEEFGPPPKKANIGSMYSVAPPGPIAHKNIGLDGGPSANFPIPAQSNPRPIQKFVPPTNELRNVTVVEPLDRRKALRRNSYNIKTIARDVLLACGRHPETRQLNQHLEILKTNLSQQVSNEADLSTFRWDLVDPGEPPAGYFQMGVQRFAEDADDELELDEEPNNQPSRQDPIGGGSTSQGKIQALPAAINPFEQQKRRSHAPRDSLPPDSTLLSTPNRLVPENMSAIAPGPSEAGVGYTAFRSATEYDADGKPLPKKRGRPVGWRKSIHGSAAAQARPGANRYTGPLGLATSQPTTLGKGDNEPIRIDSRSPTVPQKPPRYQSYKCKWQNCKAELHNLETLKKHVYKVHRKESPSGTLECFWADCGTEVTSRDPMTNMRIERNEPKIFSSEREWHDHLVQTHFNPLSWVLGDGPASGLSDANDSEACLSDAQGRRVTPRITARPEHLKSEAMGALIGSSHAQPLPAVRGRGRLPKHILEQDARDMQNRLESQKKRIGGPGIDRGGATLVNEKRRRGFTDVDETEEELVDVEG